MIIMNYYTLQIKRRFSKRYRNININILCEKYMSVCVCVILCVMCNVMYYMLVVS